MDTYGVMLYPPPFQVTSWSPPQFWQGTEPLEAGDSAGRCRPLAARKAKNKSLGKGFDVTCVANLKALRHTTKTDVANLHSRDPNEGQARLT